MEASTACKDWLWLDMHKRTAQLLSTRYLRVALDILGGFLGESVKRYFGSKAEDCGRSAQMEANVFARQIWGKHACGDPVDDDQKFVRRNRRIPALNCSPAFNKKLLPLDMQDIDESLSLCRFEGYVFGLIINKSGNSCRETIGRLEHRRRRPC